MLFCRNLNKGHKVYVFSSRPTCIDTGRTRTKHPRKQGMASAPSRKMHDSELRPNITRRPVSEKTPRSSGAVATDASYDQDFQLSVISHLDRFEQSPEPRSSTKDHRADGRNGDTRSSTKSQTRQSINRKSLREIPIEELQRSGVGFALMFGLSDLANCQRLSFWLCVQESVIWGSKQSAIK